MSNNTALRSIPQPSASHGATPADTIAADLAYSAELVRRVEADAAEATELPWWFWEAAIVVFVLTIALSAAFPWGVAS